jgi:hypothetical protein
LVEEGSGLFDIWNKVWINRIGPPSSEFCGRIAMYVRFESKHEEYGSDECDMCITVSQYHHYLPCNAIYQLNLACIDTASISGS